MDNLPYGCYVLFDKDANKLFSEARDFAGMRVDYCCICLFCSDCYRGVPICKQIPHLRSIFIGNVS